MTTLGEKASPVYEWKFRSSSDIKIPSIEVFVEYLNDGLYGVGIANDCCSTLYLEIHISGKIRKIVNKTHGTHWFVDSWCFNLMNLIRRNSFKQDWIRKFIYKCKMNWWRFKYRKCIK